MSRKAQFLPSSVFFFKFYSRLISQNVSRLLWNMTFQFRIHKNSTIDSTWARWIHANFWHTSSNLTFSVPQTIFMPYWTQFYPGKSQAFFTHLASQLVNISLHWRRVMLCFLEHYLHIHIIKVHHGPTERVKLLISRIFVTCCVAAVSTLSFLCF